MRRVRLLASVVLSIWLGWPAAVRAGDAVVPVSTGEARALRALGADLAFFTARNRPLKSLRELAEPAQMIASSHLDLARGLLAVLRAGGAPIDPGATALMTLVTDRHLGTVWAPGRRLVIVRDDGARAARVQKAGGVRVAFRDPEGGWVGRAPDVAAVRPATPVAATATSTAAAAQPVTSFGPVTRVSLGGEARDRRFSPSDVRVETRKARAGARYLVLHVARDFGGGLGVVSFLYGSGVIVEPDFARLLLEVDGRRVRPSAVFDEGLVLELGYEVPATAQRFVLVDGDARTTLAPTR